MNSSLIVTTSAFGHHPEYLHHLYACCLEQPSRSFVFVVPPQFRTSAAHLEWPSADHIRFDYLTEEEAATCSSGGMLSRSWRICRLVRRRIKQFGADRVFALTLMEHLPFAPFIYGRGVKLSGIIYKIYLYEWRRSSWLRRAMDLAKYGLMRLSGVIDRVFVLNDRAASRRLCSLYGCDKFHYLPDPYVALPKAAERAVTRRELGVADDELLFLHFGAMAHRKGTMRIVESLAHLSDEQRARYRFLFVGRVGEDIRKPFYEAIEVLKGRVQVQIEDGFCSYERLASLCAASDLLLMPYLETAQSSGVIGYASQFGVPVLASDEGLIGKLVRHYRLGHTVPPTAEELATGYAVAEAYGPVDERYCVTHRVADFQHQLCDAWFNQDC